MSGLLHEAETPCPPTSNSSRLAQTDNDVFDSLGGDELDNFEDTANIDFTTEIRAPVLTAKPRRGNRAASTFHVHDENEGKIAPAPVKRNKENVMAAAPKNRKLSLLSQPAQRFRPRVNFAPSPPKPQRQSVKPEPMVARESSPEANKTLLAQINKQGQQRQEKDALKKDVRRGTIYIPQDDTTVASAFMGLFSPVKSQDFDGEKYRLNDDTQFQSLETRIAAKRQARKPPAPSPKRAPLRPSSKIAQGTTVQVDVPGKNGGKENIPPRTIRVDGKGKGFTKVLPTHDPRPKNAALRNATCQPKATAGANGVNTSGAGNKNTTTRKTNPAQKRSVLGEKQCNSKAPTLDVTQKGDMVMKHKPAHEKKPASQKSASRAAKSPRANLATSKPPVADLKLKNLNTEYPLLTENISNTAMYEDNWLTHQEIVITQLVNGLFDYTDGNPDSDDPEILRYELLEHYQSNPLALLHKRLQASLLYGSLSIPHFVLARAGGIQQDMGFKRKFVNFWTQTYNARALRAALETVVGRRVMNDGQAPQSSPGSSPNETGTGNDKVLRRKLGHFIEVFLLRNEDMDQYATDSETKKADPASRSYRRTVLRSIMIVALLDTGKASHGTTLPRLFTPTSPFKSSTAVLQALGRMLLPSAGDINKPLGHLDCRLSNKQHELQDFDYQISNLAVDLRDGVRLTRIVELLLYLPSSCLSVVEPDSDCSTTVPLPDGELLSLSGDDGSCPLSQHLQFPCSSRAAKLFNVRIALGALASTDSTRAIASDVQAEDIVDGHREKTIALLWGLVSKWGLAGLIDWDDVRKEIERLKQRVISRFGPEHVDAQDCLEVNHDASHGGYALMLKHWAALLAQLKGLRLDNLSTNFADGKIYESIVDEYEAYILDKASQPSPEQISLSSRLQGLGCSCQFGMTPICYHRPS